MTVTILSGRARKAPRFGTWVKISLALIGAGLVAVTFAAVLAVRWYYGLDTLTTYGPASPASLSMSGGDTEFVDESIGFKAANGANVDVRHVSVRLGANSAHAVVDVRICPTIEASPHAATAGSATCAAPVAFHPGSVNLATERILVRIRADRTGTVVIKGLSVSYRQGIRSGTQHVGRAITVRVKA